MAASSHQHLGQTGLPDAVGLARAELLQALAEGRVRLAYQPQVDLASRRILAFEAVARWDHHELGELAPGLFLGLAAREGLLGVLSRTLLGEASRAVATLRKEGWPVDIAINLSAGDLTDPGFTHDAAMIARRSGADPAWLILEAGEESLAYVGEPAFAGLERLKADGFQIALDAKGPPSVALDSRARALFSQLKAGGGAMLAVTRTLRGFGASAFARRLDAARGAELPIVAVGAESEEALGLYAELGFNRVQGNVICPAVAFDEALDVLAGVPRAEPQVFVPPAPPPPVALYKGAFSLFSLDALDEDAA